MENPHDLMRAAVEQARSVSRACDNQADNMAFLIAGRLRHVSASRLVDLKKELRRFNITTGKWRDSK